MEVISQCGSGGLEDYKQSTNMAKMKVEGQLDVVEYSRITVPESTHMGDPAGRYVEMVKERNSARGHLMAWHDKQAMREHLKDLMAGSSLKRIPCHQKRMKLLNKFSWKTALQKYFDETMRKPSSVMAYIANTESRQIYK